jgi:hypothetical protein
MKKKSSSLADGDVTIELRDDPAYFALLDLGTYAKDLPDWDYASLTRRVAGQMRQARIVAWGCPEVLLRVRFTLSPLTPDVDARVVASMSGALVTDGALCFAGYTSLTMCAQFPDQAFPQPADTLLRVPKGRYKVVVHRLFEHEAGKQFPAGELPEGDHYVVELRRDPKAKAPERSHVVWAPELP